MVSYSTLLIGKTVRHFRNMHGLSLIHVSKHIGVSQPTLSRVENGSTSIRMEEFLLFIELINITYAQFFSKMKKIRPQTKITLC